MNGAPKSKVQAEKKAEPARVTAKKAHDLAEEVLQMSQLSDVDRTRVTVLSLESKKLLSSMEKRSAEKVDDKQKATELFSKIRDIKKKLESLKNARKSKPGEERRKSLAHKHPKEPDNVDQDEVAADSFGQDTEAAVAAKEDKELLRRLSTAKSLPAKDKRELKPMDREMEDIVKQRKTEIEAKQKSSKTSQQSGGETTGPAKVVLDASQPGPSLPIAVTTTAPPIGHTKRKSIATALLNVPRPVPGGTQSRVKRGSQSPPKSDAQSSLKGGDRSPSKSGIMPLLMSLLPSPNKSGNTSPVSNAKAAGSEPPGTSTSPKGSGKRKLTPSMLVEKKEVDDLVKELAKNVQAPQTEGPADQVASRPEREQNVALIPETLMTLLENEFGLEDQESGTNPYTNSMIALKKVWCGLCVKVLCVLALCLVALALLITGIAISAHQAEADREFSKIRPNITEQVGHRSTGKTSAPSGEVMKS